MFHKALSGAYSLSSHGLQTRAFAHAETLVFLHSSLSFRVWLNSFLKVHSLAYSYYASIKQSLLQAKREVI